MFYVRFEIPGEKPALLSPGWDNPDVQYYGEGLDKGYCGVYKRQVKPSNHGKVKCFLGVEREELSGEIDLIVACK